MFFFVLKKINFKSSIVFIDSNNKSFKFGSGKITLKIRLTNKSIERKLFFNPGLHLGEGYMNEEIIVEEGTIEQLIDEVTSVYDDFVRNNFFYRFYENFS